MAIMRTGVIGGMCTVLRVEASAPVETIPGEWKNVVQFKANVHNAVWQVKKTDDKGKVTSMGVRKNFLEGKIQFDTEWDLLDPVNGHLRKMEGIIKVIEGSEDPQALVYGYLDGGDWVAWSEKNPPKKEEAAIHLRSVQNHCWKLSKTLTALHKKSVFHMDLKLENVCMHKGEHVLIDFGCAFRVKEEPPSEKDLFAVFERGTPGYMSPEIEAMRNARHLDETSEQEHKKFVANRGGGGDQIKYIGHQLGCLAKWQLNSSRSDRDLLSDITDILADLKDQKDQKDQKANKGLLSRMCLCNAEKGEKEVSIDNKYKAWYELGMWLTEAEDYFSSARRRWTKKQLEEGQSKAHAENFKKQWFLPKLLSGGEAELPQWKKALLDQLLLFDPVKKAEVEKLKEVLGKVDVWCFGLTFYALLKFPQNQKKVPFSLSDGAKTKALDEKTREKMLESLDDYCVFNGIKEAKDLIRGCLQTDLNKRWTMQEVLKCEFFKMDILLEKL